MKTKTLLCIPLLVVISATHVFAASAGKRVSNHNTAPKCESRGKTIRRCIVLSDTNELELRIARDGGQIFMTLEEPPLMALNDKFIEAVFTGKTEKSVLFTLKNNNIPKGHKLIVRTKSMVLTLTFRVVTSRSDSQVEILRAGKEDRDLAVEERVQVIRDQLEKEHNDALNNLEAKVARMSRQHILNEVYARGAGITEPAGDVRERENFLVFRAKRLVRVGNERLLRVTIQERGGDTFSIGEFKAQLTQGGAKRDLEAGFRCGDMSVRPRKTVSCYVSLGAVNNKRGKAIVDITLQGEHGRRSVRLQNVEIR